MSFRTGGSARTLAGVVPAISQIRLMAETMSRRRVPVSPAWSMRPSTSARVPMVLFSFMVRLFIAAVPSDMRCQRVTFGYSIIKKMEHVLVVSFPDKRENWLIFVVTYRHRFVSSSVVGG